MDEKMMPCDRYYLYILDFQGPFLGNDVLYKPQSSKVQKVARSKIELYILAHKIKIVSMFFLGEYSSIIINIRKTL